MRNICKNSARPLLLAALCALATACQTTRSTGIDKGVCAIWGGITYSASRDTPETVLEVRRNNARRQAYCEGK